MNNEEKIRELEDRLLILNDEYDRLHANQLAIKVFLNSV